MKRIVIADIKSLSMDGKAIGHYFAVAQNYLDIFEGINEIKVAGGPIYKTKFNEKDLLLLKFNAESKLGLIANKWRELCNLRLLFNLCKDDTIIFQSNAILTVFLGIILWGRKNQDIFIIQYSTEYLENSLKRFIYMRAKRKIKGIICSNKLIGEKFDLPYTVVTDYIYTENQEDLSFIPFEEKKYDYGICGIITRDKGIIEVAQKLAGTNYSILIAGYTDDKALLDELKKIAINNNIHLKLGYLNEKEYVEAIRDCKYCLLNYSSAYSEHSSGVVFDFLFNLTPVIGTNVKALEVVKKYNVGHLYENIGNFDFGICLNKKVYEKYCNNINLLKKEQSEMAKQLILFVEQSRKD